MNYIPRPMLAEEIEDADLQKLSFPLLVSPKLDGIRTLAVNGQAYTGRQGNLCPNSYIQQQFLFEGLHGFDGELIVGSPIAKGCFQATTSGCMSRDGEPNFRYFIFDYWASASSYLSRFNQHVMGASLPSWCFPVPQLKVWTVEELLEVEAGFLLASYEGAMVRREDAPYKHGRSTFKQAYLLKRKPFKDAEAKIIGFEEQMHNANEAQQDAFGYTKRSSAQANLIPAGTLGAILVTAAPWGDFYIGTGFDAALRAEIWANRSKYYGATVKFKFQAHGTKDKPRAPVFLGFRAKEDM